MKTSRLLLAGCTLALLSGCTLFKQPSASQSRRNEQQTSLAEGTRAEYERSEAIKARASAYERRGMNREQAWSAAKAGYTGALPASRP